MKKFRAYQPEQLFLLPESIDDWLPQEHLARFVGDLIEQLDLSQIIDSYGYEKGGQPPYHPLMMTKLIVYGYCVGVLSSRRIEEATWEQVPFRFIAANQHPDHHTISQFRKRHLKSLAGLFQQVLAIAKEEGLYNLAHVSIDGTKLAANASKYETVSYEQLKKKGENLAKHVDELRKHVEAVLKKAEEIDAKEDALYGKERGNELPKALRTRESRLARIKESLEAMKQAGMDVLPKELQSEPETKPETKESPQEASKKKKDKRKKGMGGAKVVRNMTDPDSHIMRCAGGNWIQGYNAQAVVDGEAQIIVAAAVTTDGNDTRQLLPMLERTQAMTGRLPDNATADAGYFNDEQIKSRKLKDVNLLVAMPNRPPKKSKNKRGKRMFPASDTMRKRFEKQENKELYRKRKAIIEPVFGQIKGVRHFQKFTFRGLIETDLEWNLVCMTHNLMKIYRAQHVW